MRDFVSDYNNVNLYPIISNLISIDKIVFEVFKNSDRCYNFDYKEVIIKSYLEYDKTTEIKKVLTDEGLDIEEYLHSFKIIINPAKYLFKSNFYTITLEHLRDIVKNIKNKFNLDILEGIIRRLDLQCIISVKHPAENYFKDLGNFKNFDRSVKKTSLYYKSKSKSKYKTFLIYDKKKEERNFLKEFQYGEYMRLEWQYYNRFLKTMLKKHGYNQMKIKDLFNFSIFKNLIDIWISDYRAINKKVSSLIDMSKIKKPSDLDNMLINIGIDHIGGVTELEDLINRSRVDNSRRDFYSKLKRRYRDKAKDTNFTYESVLIKELNEKVEFAYQNTMNFLGI